MIISRTPFRVSFFGGGTDYPSWYREHGGSILATTIDKYCYLTCRYLPPFFEHKYHIVWSRIESCEAIDDIQHPSVRAILRYMGIDRGVEIHHDGDLPARSGMGSSSSFTVGLLHALYALQGRMPGKHQLAMESIHIEQKIMKETVGSQDQFSAAYGGLNQITFMPNGEVSVRPITLAPERIIELNAHLMLFYTGIKRTASNVAESYVKDLASKRRQLRIMKDLVDESITVLSGNGHIREFGKLLHEAWQAKRSLGAAISNAEVDDLYDQAILAGAVGGKLTGAGGGGFLLLMVPPEDQAKVRERFKQLVHVPFKFESSGSQIIFFDREQDYSAEHKARESNCISAFRELSDVSSNRNTSSLVDKAPAEALA